MITSGKSGPRVPDCVVSVWRRRSQTKVISRLKSCNWRFMLRTVKMRRNVKFLLLLSISWMFIMVYYFQSNNAKVNIKPSNFHTLYLLATLVSSYSSNWSQVWVDSLPSLQIQQCREMHYITFFNLNYFSCLKLLQKYNYYWWILLYPRHKPTEYSLLVYKVLYVNTKIIQRYQQSF